jgi:cupin superfamily acireductone dioxygenase involved in methionine salvage
MATLYIIDINHQHLVSYQKLTQDIELPGILSFSNKQTYSFEDIQTLKRDYIGNDTFHTTKDQFFDIHFHNDVEARLILKGTPIFYVCVNNFLYILECKEGDLVILQPNVVHWFSSKNELLALRLFKKTPKYQSFSPKVSKQLENIHAVIEKSGIQFQV